MDADGSPPLSMDTGQPTSPLEDNTEGGLGMTPEDCAVGGSTDHDRSSDPSGTQPSQPPCEFLNKRESPCKKLSPEDLSDSSLSDVETFTGKIVYNPDGSAYIIENVESENSEEDIDLPQQEGSIVDGRGMTPPNIRVFPQVVNAFHISRNPALYSALYGQAYSLLQEKKKVPEVPIMHSYRVFTVRDKKESEEDSGERPSDSLDKASSLPFLDYSSVPIKPILMCFICKLSFGYSKSFVGHATGEHNITLCEDERHMLSQKNISAIIQGVGKDKEPLLSFLEPLPSLPQQSSAGSGHKFQGSGLLKQQTVRGSSSSSSSSSLVTTDPVSSLLNAVCGAHEVTTLVSTCCSPVLAAPAIMPAVPANREPDEALAPELEDLANIEKMAKAAAAAAAGDSLNLSLGDKTLCKASALEGNSGLSLVVTTSALSSTSSCPTTSVTSTSSTGNHSLEREAQRTPPTPASSGAPGERPTSAGSAGSSSPGISISPKLMPPSQIPFLGPCPSPTPSSSGLLAVCSQHPDGKTNGVECPKCDMILGSSRSLGGHMTMMHSRNSCKTLKCPKCNWHYKYQETLEIHMKEKHPENDMNCIYCLTNQPHPRLARGETYTCGYKPYRCEVCNYSTTTKGNLSIHMQSDKHINNIQELQNGTLAPEHILQQSSQPMPPASIPEAAKKPVPASKPKATWRCDVCNYETNVARNLRIHMTSEKHTHNMMVLQQNVKHMQQLSALQQAQALDPLFQFHPGLLLPCDSQLQPEAALADMAYNHALLMMASQHHQQQAMAAAAAAAAAASSKSPAALGSPMAMGPNTPTMDMEHPDPTLRLDISVDETSQLFQCCVCGLFSVDSVEALGGHFQQDRTRHREDEVLMAVAGSYICKLCTYKTNLKANFQLHCKTDKHLQRLQHVNHIKEGGARNDWKLKYVNISNPVQVRCNACDYYTNSVHKLQLHTANPRHELSARLFLFLVSCENMLKAEATYYQCSLCNFHTRKRSSLIAHAHSIRHLRADKLHRRPEDDDDSWRDTFSVKEFTGSEQISFDSESEVKGPESADPDLPPPVLTQEEKLDQPAKASDPPSPGSMLKQALLDPAAKANSVNQTSEESSEQHTCPLCNFTSKSEAKMQMHVLSQHSQQPKSVQCPLCQDQFRELPKIEAHLIEVHNVSQESVQRLLALVDTSVLTSSQQQSQQGSSVSASQSNSQQTSSQGPHQTTTAPSVPPSQSPTVPSSGKSPGPLSLTNEDSMSEPMDGDGHSDNESKEKSIFDELTPEDLICSCGKAFTVLDELFVHQNESNHLELKQTPRGLGYMCWKKSCSQYFLTAQAVQVHFREIHSKKPQLAVSERHVYKYRCSQCSLAFKTLEKLQLHSQYHIIRAATQCVLCGRSFRSVAALQKHVETSHMDMSPEELEQYRASLANNPLLASGGGAVLDPQTTELLKKESNRDDTDMLDEPMDTSLPPDDGLKENESDGTDGTDAPQGEGNFKEQFFEDYINSQAIAEDSYNDPTRKYKCHRCKVAFTRQSYLTSHNKTLLHRKGEKLSYPMEKYLDPNRPYKCDICKESFTQKNILLVHYNSVSHLHKLKLSMKENTSSNAVTNSTGSQSASSTPSPNATVTLPPANSSSGACNNSNSNNNNSNNCISDSDKKPYKCNICKVAYSQGSTLDIHMRSVLHQTRASKLHELAMTGQVDLSSPLVERPETGTLAALELTTAQPQQKSLADILGTKPLQPIHTPPANSNSESSPKLPDLPPLNLSTPTTSAGTSSAGGTLQISLGSESSTLQQALNIASHIGQPPVLLPSQVSSQGLPTCQRCSAIFMSQEALAQHQQLYCFFNQQQSGSTVGNASSNLPQTPTSHASQKSTSAQIQQQHTQQQQQLQSQLQQLSALQSQAQQQQQTSQQQQHLLAQQVLLHQHHTSQQNAAQQLSHSPSQNSTSESPAQMSPQLQSASQQIIHVKTAFTKAKPPMYKHLLESYGFDVVMQFNEFNQRRIKKEAEKREQEENSSAKGSQPPSPKHEPGIVEEVEIKKEKVSENEAESEKDVDNSMPEINRSVCNLCQKEFSSIWVLKAHREEIHHDVVPLDFVSKLAEDFRTEYERKNASQIPAEEGMLDLAGSQAVGQSEQTIVTSSVSSSTTTISSTSTTVNSVPQSSQLSTPTSVTPPVTSLPNQQNSDVASSVTASQMAAQLQFNQLLMSMGLGMGLPMGMNMPFAAAAMNLHPPLIPVVMPPHLDPLMASAFNHPMMPGAIDPNFFAAQQKLLQQQQQQLAQAQQQQKRARTRISDEQLRILRAYFDINNSPTEEQLMEMSEKSGLPLKVIKHWFRNTLFKERQRNKDSPYNFNNPPSTYLNLEEYEKTGEAKVIPITPSENNNNTSEDNKDKETSSVQSEEEAPPKKEIKEEVKIEAHLNTDTQDSIASSTTTQNGESMTPRPEPTTPLMITKDITSSVTSRLSIDTPTSCTDLIPASPLSHSFLLGTPPTPTLLERSTSTPTPTTSTPTSTSSSGKRANRTRFTDYQIKVLQEFFETNAYPKDDDLEYLSKLLNLSPRVIVVWFQNARQKARKVYENQPPVTQEEDTSGRFQRTPGLNYQCKKCLQVFQRYYELIKHQKSSCFKDENPLAAQLKTPPANEERTVSIVSNQTPPRTPDPNKFPQNGTYRCDKCSLVFPRFDLWREHQIVHIMNPNLFPNYPPNSSFGILQYEGQQPPAPPLKRKLDDEDSKEQSSEPPRDKRLRTTILPEQLDYLYQKYQMESNPSRKMLENIARDVGLKKRVVQVWFQNTRARERKGQFRAHQQVIHKRCPFCRALFKARSALESHLATRHADLYSKGELNIDSFPDGDADSNPDTPTSSASEESKGTVSTPNAPLSTSPSVPFSQHGEVVQNTMKKYYEDSLKKYLDELSTPSHSVGVPTDLSFKQKTSSGKPEGSGGEFPLDLSKPLRMDSDRSGDHLSVSDKSMEEVSLRLGISDDARSETHSESTDNMEGDDVSFESNPTSPMPTGLHGAAAPQRPMSGSGKRFRTQMTTMQLKVMKSIFADYKTPSMAECEMLGREIGLPKRVVQVWFQNARAKEKKSKLAFAKTFGQEMESTKPPEECTMCGVKYNHKFSNTSMQDHLFSKRHINALRNHIDSIKKLTDGQESSSDRPEYLSSPSLPTSGFPPTSSSNSSNNSGQATESDRNQPSLVQQLQMLGLPQVAGLPIPVSLPNFVLPSGSPKEEKGKKESKDSKDGKDSSTGNKSKDDSNKKDSPTTSQGNLLNPMEMSLSSGGDGSGLFPYMYAGFPGYYAGMPGAFLHPTIYTGRNKL